MIYHGDLFDVLPTLEAESIDACVTDPPYGLEFMGKEWDKIGVAGKRTQTLSPAMDAAGVGYYKGRGVVSKDGDGRAQQDWHERWAREVFRVLKPGGYLLAFGGTRTSHRMVCAIEDAGFEIRDSLSWIFGSGFPKSLNLGDGRGTALKPAYEPICMARKPLRGTVAANVARYGTGAINIDATRIGYQDAADLALTHQKNPGRNGELVTSDVYGADRPQQQVNDLGRWPANVLLDEWHEQVLYLKYNTPTDAARVIKEYFSDYTVPGVPERHHDVSEPDAKTEGPVLLSDVLCTTPLEDEARPVSSHVRQETLGGFAGEDASKEASHSDSWAGQSELERQFPIQWVRDDFAVGGQGDPGAQAGDAGGSGSAIAAVGGCTSPEWSEGRQPAGEPRTPRQRHAQAISRGDSARVESATPRVRDLEVLESDVPVLWRQYFDRTGLTVRRGAAAMLDEQTGYSSGLRPDMVRHNRQDTGAHGIYGTFPAIETSRYGDSGGASRFFYTAKPSREERDYGTEHLTARKRDESRKDGNPGGDNPRNRGLQPRGNSHPTVKPVELMRWLVKLVTPLDGVVLDPFTGSGTTGMACRYESRRFVGIEREAEYHQIAEARIAAVAPLFGEETA